MIMWTSQSYAIIGAIIGGIQSVGGFLSDHSEQAQLVQQYAEMISLTQEQIEEVQKTNTALDQLNEWGSMISEHTGIKITTTEEAYKLLVDEDHRNETALEGLLTKKPFADNPEYARALRKVMREQDLSVSDIAGLYDVLMMDPDSEALIVRRLQRKGYSEKQIKTIMRMIKDVKSNQEKIVAAQEAVLKVELSVEAHKKGLDQLKKECAGSDSKDTKEKCPDRIMAKETLYVQSERLLIEKQRHLNALLQRQSNLISRLSWHEIQLDSEIQQQKNINFEIMMAYEKEKTKADLAEEKTDDFIFFTQQVLGGNAYVY